MARNVVGPAPKTRAMPAMMWEGALFAATRLRNADDMLDAMLHRPNNNARSSSTTRSDPELWSSRASCNAAVQTRSVAEMAAGRAFVSSREIANWFWKPGMFLSFVAMKAYWWCRSKKSKKPKKFDNAQRQADYIGQD